MSATVIDTLRFADSLKAAGFEAPKAEGLARALGDELAERMLTKGDLHDALRPINRKFDSIDARFDGIDARFDGIDARLDAMDTRFDAMDTRFDAMDTKFDAMNTKIDAVHRELSGKFNILVGMMALGFTLLVGLGGYNAVAPRFAETVRQAPEPRQEPTALHVTPASRLFAEV